jgi:hypothetical protein
VREIKNPGALSSNTVPDAQDHGADIRVITAVFNELALARLKLDAAAVAVQVIEGDSL